MLVGYARVSTDAQDNAAQVAVLKAAGAATVIAEKVSCRRATAVAFGAQSPPCAPETF